MGDLTKENVPEFDDSPFHRKSGSAKPVGGYLSERVERLHEALARVNALAANGELPDAEIQASVPK